MTKDLGYYASDRDGFFDGLVEQYGSTLQKIAIDDKFFMLAAIAEFHLIGGDMQDSLDVLDEGEDTPADVRNILLKLEELDSDVQFGFMEALLNQVRESYRSQKSFKTQLCNAGVEDSLAQEVSVILANGGDRTQAQCELVSEAWEIAVKSNRNLAARMDAAMGVSA